MIEIYANRKVEGVLTQLTFRFDGRIVYLKGTKEEIIANKDAVTLITGWETQGATVDFGETWAEINFFAIDKKIEYHKKLIAENVEELTHKRIESLIVNMFKKQLRKGNFIIIERKLKKNG